MSLSEKGHLVSEPNLSIKSSEFIEGIITRSQSQIFTPSTYSVKEYPAFKMDLSNSTSKIVGEKSTLTFPTDDNSEAIWNKYLDDTTVKVKVEGLRDAQIIFLGETHTEKWHRPWAKSLITRYRSGQGDIVLIEGIQSLRKTKSKFEIENVKCFGWDDDYWYFKALKYVKLRVDLINKYEESNPSSKWSENDIEAWKTINGSYLECNKARDKSMVATLNKIMPRLRPGQKVFVISGSSHLLRIAESQSNPFSSFKTSMVIPKKLSSNTPHDDLSYMKKIALFSSV